MLISLPLVSRSWLAGRDKTSLSLKDIFEFAPNSALGSGSNLISDMAVTDLPDPDSPTRPTISFSDISNEAFLTA